MPCFLPPLSFLSVECFTSSDDVATCNGNAVEFSTTVGGTKDDNEDDDKVRIAGAGAGGAADASVGGANENDIDDNLATTSAAEVSDLLELELPS